MKTRQHHLLRHLALAAAATLAVNAASAATVKVVSRDPAGVGFNDTTPVAPVGGNPGTTLGEQRMNAYLYVAGIWGKALTSSQEITISAGWEALTCDASSAVLGSAGAWNFWHDAPGLQPGIWYQQALANKLAGTNLSAGTPDDGTGYGNVDIKSQFNINLGQSTCLSGSPFYLGLDGKPPGSQVNFVEVLLHEVGHGLGFALGLTSTASGLRVNADFTAYVPDGLPMVWEQYMLDNTTGKTWLAMTPAERVASTLNDGNLAWTGPNAVAGAKAMLLRAPTLSVVTPVPGVAGNYNYGTATFGAPAYQFGTMGAMALPAVGNNEGCSPLGKEVAGKVAVIDRGTCTFSVKAANAQAGGAIGVIIANNFPAGTTRDKDPAPGMSGADPTVTIPVVSLSYPDGVKIKGAIPKAAAYGSRTTPGKVTGVLTIDASKPAAGADMAGRPLLYAPTTRAAGSSVSHWDTRATPNLLMEPFINSDLGTSLVVPKDLTIPLLKDIGW